MNYHVTLTGEFGKGAKPGTPLWVNRAKIVNRVMAGANDPRHPWEVRVAGQKWNRSV